MTSLFPLRLVFILWLYVERDEIKRNTVLKCFKCKCKRREEGRSICSDKKVNGESKESKTSIECRW